MSYEGLISRIYKELLKQQQKDKQLNFQMGKKRKKMNNFSKEDIQMADKHMK